MNGVLLGVLAYVAVQLVVGLLVTRRVHNESDYILAGRSFGYPMLTMSIFATWFGAETCIGASGEVYAHGLAGARMDPFGYTLCLLLAGLLIAAPLWRRKYTTLADLFRERYSVGVERLAVILLVPTSVMWAAAQIRAFGSVIAATSDFHLEFAITAAAISVIVYTASGGLLADAVTDFLQGIMLIFGLVIMTAFLGWKYFHGELPPLEASRFALSSGDGEPVLQQMETWCVPIIGSLISQELIARTLGARTETIAKWSCLYGGALYLVVGLMPVGLGLIGPSLLPALESPESYLPQVAQHLLSPFLYVLFAGALISAILSTVDSALLAAGALFSHNLVLPLFRLEDERAKLRISRCSVVGFGILAYFLALSADGVHDLVEEASAFGSAGIFITTMFGLFSGWGGRWTALATLMAGLVSYLSGNYLMDIDYPYLLSLLCALATYLLVGVLETKHARAALPPFPPAA